MDLLNLILMNIVVVIVVVIWLLRVLGVVDSVPIYLPGRR